MARITPPPVITDQSVFRPTDHGLLSWGFDPALASSTSGPTGGVLYLVKLRVPAGVITNILVHVGVGGSSLTSNQNFAALYDSSGTRVALTADQTTAWGTAGVKVMALTGTYAAAGGVFYVGLLSNGTTPPTFARAVNLSVANAGLGAGSYRFATSGTGQTATPSSVALASAAASSIAFWVALS